ncbi:glycoside hydrolase family 10 protein [Streptomyces sp. NPDC003023]|uniref:glycoside hydrolase family 10 protein n=1 Tax=Streptomyces sp. NPDC003023 TaxID=3364675 RepID=UPI00369F4C45
MGRIGRRGFVATAAGAFAAFAAAGDAAAARTPSGAAPDGAFAAEARGRQTRREFRGMWLATVGNRDWPSQPGLTADRQRAELLSYLDTAVRRRLNAVVFQVRPTADALWPSPYEPWSQYLTGFQGRDPGWDPLGTAVREAHRRGLELHAWFNPYRVATHTDPTRLVANHPARLHPEWTIAYGGKLYYDPGIPEVRRFVQDAMLDAVVRYDIEAVHFDDYFYPYPVPDQVFDDDATFARYGDGFTDKAAWRRDNINRLVREMAARIKAAKKHVRFGISPFGVWRNAATDPLGSRTEAGVQTYDDLHADTRRWVTEGWIDYVVPQVYWNMGFPPADYEALVPWWAQVARDTGVDLFIGEALYKVGVLGQPEAWHDPEELSRHLTYAKRYPEVGGHCYFSAMEVVDDPLGAMTEVVADHYPTRVRPPA